MKEKEIIKYVFKKEKHKGGHGGAWKVAYADFVTALMALFIVLWLTSQSNQVKTAVSDYFKDPGKYTAEQIKRAKVRAMVIAKGGEAVEKVAKQKDSDKMDIVIAVQEFRNVLNNMRLDSIEEGVKIEMADTNQTAFFEAGSAKITRDTEIRLRDSLKNMGILPYPMVIEGHTDATPTGRTDYTNWELSMDRANAVRRIIAETKTAEVIGVKAYGSTMLAKPAFPSDPVNRRVGIIVQIPKSHFGYMKR
ncbi:MAG: OmpA family protein [Nitrospinae bacterium]|nr:OmpA family protein [Nitrospinota bacterium]